MKGDVVLISVEEYCGIFIQGLEFLLTTSPCRVQLDTRFVGNASEHIQNQLWVEKYKAPGEIHRFANEIQ